MIPDPSGQLAEQIVYITSTRGDLYSRQILFTVFRMSRTDGRDVVVAMLLSVLYPPFPHPNQPT